MGITQIDFWIYNKYTEQFLKETNKTPQEVKILEFGNQWFWGDDWIKQSALPRVCKHYWQKLGYDHTSIDINGQDGALSFDLTKPLPEEFSNQYDIIINAGTAEHVDNQYECWKNFHKCLKVEGLLFSAFPAKDRQNTHCCNFFTDTEFFDIFAKKLSYTILMNEYILYADRDGYYVFTVMKKNKQQEFSFEEDEINSLFFDKRLAK